MPLFDGQDNSGCDCEKCEQCEEKATINVEVVDTSDPAAVDVDPEAWRNVPLTETTIPPGILAILAECPDKAILTVGDLADWTAEKPLTKIPRVGKSKAEKIEASMLEFWATHKTG
jgi:hypothetical protein